MSEERILLAIQVVDLNLALLTDPEPSTIKDLSEILQSLAHILSNTGMVLKTKHSKNKKGSSFKIFILFTNKTTGKTISKGPKDSSMGWSLWFDCRTLI